MSFTVCLFPLHSNAQSHIDGTSMQWEACHMQIRGYVKCLCWGHRNAACRLLKWLGVLWKVERNADISGCVLSMSRWGFHFKASHLRNLLFYLFFIYLSQPLARLTWLCTLRVWGDNPITCRTHFSMQACYSLLYTPIYLARHIVYPQKH